MGLTVLNVAYPLTPVGRDAAGGSEQVLTLLDRNLTKSGNRSIVIDAENSVVSGDHIPSPAAPALLDEPAREWGRNIHRQLIEYALSKYSIDVIHMHALDFHCYIPEVRPPLLATLHLPPDWYPQSIFTTRLPQFHLNFVSNTQADAAPPSVNPTSVISNGIESEEFDVCVPKQDYLVALGRICPEKGFHFALEAAKLSGSEFVLAGEVFPYRDHLRYFDSEIKPKLDEHRRFIGPVGFEKKKKLLAAAKCMLITSTVSETSSLVAMEAAAAGTPVIAFPSGAVNEIVEPGRTGFLVGDVKEMAAAIEHVGTLSPATCREAARRRFSACRMALQYFDLYQRLTCKFSNA